LTDLPDVKLKALVKFPVAVEAGAGIGIDLTAGTYTVSRDDSLIQRVSTVSSDDLPNQRQIIWDSIRNEFSSVPFALSATAGVASLGAQTGIIDLGFGLSMVGSTLKSTAVPSVGAAIGNALRATGAALAPAYVDSGFISTEEFGCLGNGVAGEDDDAFQDVVDYLEANGGGNIRVKGNLCLGQEFSINASNVRFFGSGRFRDGISVAPGLKLGNGLLQFSNQSHIILEKMFFLGTGNTTESNYGSTGPIGWFNDENASTDTLDFILRHCYLSNFRTSSYVNISQHADEANTLKMRGFAIYDNLFNADAGYASSGINPADGLANPTGNTFIALRGNTKTGANSDNGSIAEGLVYGNRAQGLGCSGFINIQYNSHDILDFGNVTENMGSATLAEDRAYVHGVYRSDTSARSPYNIIIANNVGNGNHANAVYAAGIDSVTVVNNTFTGTRTSTVWPTLPHGAAIAFNGCSGIICKGNRLKDNAVGIYWGQDTLKISVDIIEGNDITCSAITGLNACGILLNPDSASTPGDNSRLTTLNVANNNIVVTGASAVGITFNSSINADTSLLQYQYGRIRIRNNDIKSVFQGISSGGTLLAAELIFDGNTINGELTNYAAVIAAGSSPLYIRNETIDFSEVLSGSSNGYNLDGCTNVTINGLSLANKTNGSYALSMIGTRGRCNNVTFPGTTSTRVAATSAGLSTPNWTGQQFDTWQNFQSSFYTETGSTPKYTLDSFVWSTSTTWLERRMPTGG
jgi:hypothetical protein